ncbi:MAG: TOBE domain-containing protein [Sulfurovum sp.]|nr:TOBE domain-containing protein [Sulfurovum sp.]
MSYIIATVSEIKNVESLHYVTFTCHKQNLSMISLELDKDVQIDKKVKLVVKSSHVAIAKEFTGLVSYANQLAMTVHSINKGKLLCSVTLEFFDMFIESIITRDASEKMSLTSGDHITVFIKASEIAICEILDD